MTDKTLNAKTRKLHTLMEQIRSLETLAEMTKKQITDELEARDTEMVKTIDGLVVKWQEVTTNRFDGSAFKLAQPELYRAYLKATCSRRFTLTA